MRRGDRVDVGRVEVGVPDAEDVGLDAGGDERDRPPVSPGGGGRGGIGLAVANAAGCPRLIPGICGPIAPAGHDQVMITKDPCTYTIRNLRQE
jgi:hypothetical protein